MGNWRTIVPGLVRATALVLVVLSLTPSAVDAAASDSPPYDPAAIAGSPAHPGREPVFEDFVGSDACAQCHAGQFALWRESTHGRAGGAPSPSVAVMDFDGTVLRFADATVHLEVDPDGRFLYHVDQQGRSRQTLEVVAFVGGGHMEGGGTQASFVKFPDGSLRLLPFDYHREQNLWFCEARFKGGWVPITTALPLDTCRYWPPQNNFGSNCGNCHSSQMEQRYSPEERKESVRHRDLAINCESCHGPGRRHVDLIRSGDWQRLDDIGMEPLALRDKNGSLEVCFRCHAMGQQLEPGFLPGKRFEDYYSVHSHFGSTHLGDGRVNGFGYQEGHLWSDCYLSGSMTCVDCHDPHSQRYRDVDGFPIPGKFDDRQCLGCHGAKATEPERHTHHARGSPGSRCTSCHMPFLQQQDFGRTVRYERSDHAIPIPRPRFDARLGLENACSTCHQDKGLDWQQARVDEWYGELKPHNPAVRDLMQARHGTSREDVIGAFLRDHQGHPAAEFELLRIAGARQASLDAGVLERMKALAGSNDIDVRSLALSYLHEAQDETPQLGSFVARELASLASDDRAVRRRWSLWLQVRAQEYMQSGQAERALSALQKAVTVTPQDPVAHIELGVVVNSSGRPLDAIRHWRTALDLGPRSPEMHAWLAEAICGARESLAGSGVAPDPGLGSLCGDRARSVK